MPSNVEFGNAEICEFGMTLTKKIKCLENVTLEESSTIDWITGNVSYEIQNRCIDNRLST